MQLVTSTSSLSSAPAGFRFAPGLGAPARAKVARRALTSGLFALGALAAAADSSAAIPAPLPDANFFCGFVSTCGGTGYSYLAIDRGFNFSDRQSAAFPLPDGKTSLVGTARGVSDRLITIGQLLADGTPDSTFALGGYKVSTVDVATIDDVKRDATGRTWVLYEPTGSTGLGLARFTAAGVLDTTFSADGSMTFDMAANQESFGKLVLTPDGKAIVAAALRVQPFAWQIGVARITADGNLDSTFDGDGIDQIDPANSGYPVDRWQPDVLVPGGNGSAVATFIAGPNSIGTGSSPAFEASVIVQGNGTVGFGIGAIDAADYTSCTNAIPQVGATRFADAVVRPGGYVAVGSYIRSDTSESRALFAFVPNAGEPVIECFAGDLFGTPLAIAALGSDVYGVNSYIDNVTRRLELVQIENGDNFTPIVIPASRALRRWPGQSGAAATLSDGSLSAGYGRVILGTTRRWTNTPNGDDEDFAVAAYTFDDRLFADSFE